jgi:3-methyladenine DNA glycosylase AlkD
MDDRIDDPLGDLRLALRAKATEKRRISNLRFFKTGPGEYGHGDQFLGVSVPEIRIVARQYRHLATPDLTGLIRSPIHEERLLGLMILRIQYESANRAGDEKQVKKLLRFYLANLKSVNNWDLVDSSAPYVSGHYWFHFLTAKERMQVLLKLARSKNLWLKRVAVVSAFYGIRQKQFVEIIKLSELLLHDSHDLIQKAVGWMLREVGKRDQSTLIDFLDRHAHIMPRTMLRYSIERLSPRQRKQYLSA